MTEWSDARKRGFIVSVLRSGTRRWPPKYQALSEACVGIRYNEKTKRNGKHYSCKACEGEFPSSKVQVDHIAPVVDPKTGFTTWDAFIEGLFCGKENLQVLCIECHSQKTATERAEKVPTKKKKVKT